MYESSLETLEKCGIQLERGISKQEFEKIEEIYQIKFPNSLKRFLETALPISDGFYNWRDFSSKNIEYIKEIIHRPWTDIEEMASDVYWCDNWGREPDDKEDIAKEVRKRIKTAPALIPIFLHRYMPVISSDNVPIISVEGLDIIYYGQNLEDYFDIEFGEKKQEEMDFETISYISFWSDVM